MGVLRSGSQEPQRQSASSTESDSHERDFNGAANDLSLPTQYCVPGTHLIEGACYHCCEQCNFDVHRCHGCGVSLMHNGREWNDKPHLNCPE